MGRGSREALVDTDVGDSGLATGSGSTRRSRPHPKALAAAVGSLVKSWAAKARSASGFPAVLKEGWVLTASNIDMSCIGVNAVELFFDATGREVAVINDADAAGLGEYRFGAVKESHGHGDRAHLRDRHRQCHSS